jgi:hypothetical protein
MDDRITVILFTGDKRDAVTKIESNACSTADNRKCTVSLVGLGDHMRCHLPL